jgi:hypothetical protein
MWGVATGIDGVCTNAFAGKSGRRTAAPTGVPLIPNPAVCLWEITQPLGLRCRAEN